MSRRRSSRISGTMASVSPTLAACIHTSGPDGRSIAG
jgi:hypothetical protein